MTKNPFVVAALFLALVAAATAQIETPRLPPEPAAPTASVVPGVLPLAAIERVEFPALDRNAIAVEDEQRAALGLAPRFAILQSVWITPDTGGTWEMLDERIRMWRLRIAAEGALSINLGFTRYAMPPGARLMLYSTDGREVIRPFTDYDNRDHGELWTPVLLADEIVVELTVPHHATSDVELELTRIGQGYRGFGKGNSGGLKLLSGGCHVDVVCPQGDPWRSEIPSVGVISTGGTLFCSGFMVNNTRNDRAPLFATANHCGLGPASAASLVVYWNYETSRCGAIPDGRLGTFSTGAWYRAGHTASDFALVHLNAPPNPAWGVTYAGWDRSGANAPSAVGIHHPSCDEKRISFENQPIMTTAYLGTSVPGDGTHFRVVDWDLGSTEPGSSGSPLFDPSHRVIGELHGGYARCGNNLSDWYGKLSVAWNGGGSPSTRLRDWLDPAGTGAPTLDTLVVELSVTPASNTVHTGSAGGPFTSPTVTYSLTNRMATPINYRVSLNTNLGLLLNGGTTPVTGTVAPNGGRHQLTVTLGPAIDQLSPGEYHEDIRFEDLSNTTVRTRRHTVEIDKVLAYDFPLDSDPGWDLLNQGQWEFGPPQGYSASSGRPDPTSGYTGQNVYGYNLQGGYQNGIPEYHLTTTPLDCSGLTGVHVSYWRWLNVERPFYDHAYFRVSYDRSNWTTIWENTAEITDASWVAQSFDISSVADGRPRVYLRWTMGPTDPSSGDYTGWNVDDVRLWGFARDYFLPYGAGCPSASYAPILSGEYPILPARQGTISLNAGPPAPGIGALLVAFAQGSGCLLVNPPFSTFILPLDPGGAAAFSFPIPPQRFGGAYVYNQALVTDGREIAFSNGLALYVE